MTKRNKIIGIIVLIFILLIGMVYLTKNIGEVSITTLGEGSNKVTFIVPIGFNKTSKKDLTYSSFSDNNENTIRYTYYGSDAKTIYKGEKEKILNNRYQEYEYKVKEFKIRINKKKIKCYIEEEISNDKLYKVFAVYPVNEKTSVKIEINSNKEISKDNIKNYIKVR